MDRYDFAIIGAGPGGEAAANKARELGASVAIVDSGWFGGSCPHIGCVPSKALLNSAARHAENPATYDWARASARRDYMINRAPDAAEPDDRGHVTALEAAGAVAYRGTARIVGPGRVAITHDGVTHEIGARNVVVAVGSTSKAAPIDGHRAGPGLDEPRGDPGPDAAGEPADPGRRADGLRARAGLRPVRRADDHRPVRPAARADRSSAQLRGGPPGPRA